MPIPGDTADDLTVDNHRIDHGAAIFDHRIIEDLIPPVSGIDRDNRALGRIAKHAGVTSG